MKWIVCLLILLSCAGRYPPTSNVTPGLVSSEYSVSVRLIVLCIDGPKVASGVIVSNKHILTAKHAVTCEIGDPLIIGATDLNFDQYQMTIDKVSAEHDMARLVAADGAEPFKLYARLTTEAPELGSQVCMVTGDDNVFLMRKCGELGLSSPQVYRSNQHCVPGNSGSALFNDVGYVVGIVARGSWAEGEEYITISVNFNAVKGELLNDIYPYGF